MIVILAHMHLLQNARARVCSQAQGLTVGSSQCMESSVSMARGPMEWCLRVHVLAGMPDSSTFERPLSSAHATPDAGESLLHMAEACT